MASTSDSGLSALDGAWDASDQPAPRPSPMSVVDSRWSEPHGIPIESAPLADGTAPLRAPTADELVPAPPILPDPPRFFDMPVGRPPGARSCSTSRPALGHDATSIVMPLPLARAIELGERPRAVGIASEHAARLRNQKQAAKAERRRGRLVLIVSPLVGIALGFLALALWPEPEGRRVEPQQEAAPAPAPVAAPAPASKARPASVAAPKLAASKKPAASVAPEPIAPAPSRVAASSPKAPAPTATRTAAPAGKPAKKVATRAEPAPRPAASSARKPAGATKPGASVAAASKPGKPASPAKKPAPAKKLAPAKKSAR